MKKLIDIEDLRLGMYVCGFDRAWIKTPFLSHHFLVDSQQLLIKILALDIDNIYIDTEKGLDLEEPEVPAPVEAVDSVSQRQYASIKVSSLKPGMILPFDLYQNTDSGKQLCLKRGAEYTSFMRQELARDGVQLIYINAGDEDIYVRYLEDRNVERNKRATYTNDEFSQYNKNKSIHFPLERALLVPGTKVDFSIYCKRGFFYDPLLIIDHAIPVEIAERHVRADGELSIRSEDIPRYQEYITRHLNDKGGDYRTVAMATRENAKMKVREILGNHSDGKSVLKTAEGVVEDMIGVIMGRKGAFISLLNLNARDMYTYIHSVNVATLAISLGNTIGLGKDQLFDLGLGCILHDIGKSLVSSEILNKPDPLTMREIDAMKKHVIYGHEIVRAYDDIPPGALIPILQHHETVTGSGYPYGVRGSGFGLFGKISSIVDMYDSITTDRPYKKAFTPFYALSVISKERDNYDSALFAGFVKMLGTNA